MAPPSEEPHKPSPEEENLDEDFARFREQRLRATGRHKDAKAEAPRKVVDPKLVDSLMAPPPAPPAEPARPPAPADGGATVRLGPGTKAPPAKGPPPPAGGPSRPPGAPGPVTGRPSGPVTGRPPGPATGRPPGAAPGATARQPAPAAPGATARQQRPAQAQPAPAGPPPADAAAPAAGVEAGVFFGTAAWERRALREQAVTRDGVPPAPRRTPPPRRLRRTAPPLPTRPGAAGGVCFLSPSLPAGIYVLKKERATIGRAPGTDVLLAHNGVSRQHAEVTWRDDVVAVRDLQSANGTLVNGARSEGAVALRNDDVVTVGPFELRFRVFDDVNVVLAEASRANEDGTARFDSVWILARLGHELSTKKLLELCHIISLRSYDGVLSVYGADYEGTVEFAGGDIVGGACGQLQGDDAAWVLLSQELAQVTFERGTADTSGRPRVDTGTFLLELSEAISQAEAGETKEDGAAG